MGELRDYQMNALREIDRAHETQSRVVCVMPTGAGKSVVGRAWVAGRVAAGQRGLMLAHRIELLRQFQGHLAAVGIDAGIISPGHPAESWKKVQCASMDTLVARGEVPMADFVLGDECHHLAAETWRPLVEAQPMAKVLGLTATPQRGDGKPLADIFESLVVGAQYSALMKMGHIVRCKVFRPEKFLEAGFAQDPVDAWIERAGEMRGFIFCRSVAEAKRIAEELTVRGVPSANVDGKLRPEERQCRMEAFASGDLRVLTNVHVLTEGVDVPNAQCCMLACSTSVTATYLQKVGRVLRPAPGKEFAVLIDLPGVSWIHGLPTSDREYSLSGRAIRETGASLRNCPKCGWTQESSFWTCENCGHEWPRKQYDGPKIWNLELLEYFENVGELDTAPKQLKMLEWDRLMDVASRKGFGVSFAVNEYEKIFKAPPEDKLLKEIDDSLKVKELRRLLGVQMSKGLKPGWISHAYKNTFGRFPSRELRSAAGVPLPSNEAFR